MNENQDIFEPVEPSEESTDNPVAVPDPAPVVPESGSDPGDPAVPDEPSDPSGSDGDSVVDTPVDGVSGGSSSDVGSNAEVIDKLDEIQSVLLQSDALAVPADYPASAPLAGGYYFDCDAGLLYVPKEVQHGSFTLNASGDLVNITESTVRGLLERSGSSYEAQFTSFGTLQYRVRTGSYWEWQDISSGTISSTNVEILDDGNAVRLWPSFDVLAMVMLFLMGVIAWRQFMNR